MLHRPNSKLVKLKCNLTKRTIPWLTYINLDINNLFLPYIWINQNQIKLDGKKIKLDGFPTVSSFITVSF